MSSKIRHIFCVLLCLVMALSLTGTALAYDGSEGEQDITIRSLTYNEIAECNEVDDSIDRGRSDKYGVYLAMVEPDLLII